jgi:flagellar motor switch protein FliM
MAPSTNHLGRARIGQLLAAVGSLPATEPTPQATPYDWRDPHCFNADQQNRLAQAFGQVATRMAEIFTRSRGGTCEVSLKAFTQHFAGDLCQHLDLDREYCLAFAPDKGALCGFVSIASQTALTWVTWLLGDTDSTRDPAQALSALEGSLLSDLFTAVLEAFLAPLRTPHNLKPVASLCQSQPSLPFELTDEVAQIVFQVKSGDQGKPGEMTLVLPCSRLAALAGKTATPTPKIAPQELSRALMEHLQEVPVTVRATLASTTVPFHEVLDLGPGDILLLDKPMDGLMELTFDGHTVFRGRPARSEGRYAVVILEAQASNGLQTATAKTAKQANERT